MEPYGGNMPLFKSDSTNDATVTIVEEAYDDGMKVTRIQTPPRQNTRSLIAAIDNILGLMNDLDIGTMSKDDDKNASKIQPKRESEKKEDNNDSDNKLPSKSGFGSKDNESGMASEKEMPDISR